MAQAWLTAAVATGCCLLIHERIEHVIGVQPWF